MGLGLLQRLGGKAGELAERPWWLSMMFLPLLRPNMSQLNSTRHPEKEDTETQHEAGGALCRPRVSDAVASRAWLESKRTWGRARGALGARTTFAAVRSTGRCTIRCTARRRTVSCRERRKSRPLLDHRAGIRVKRGECNWTTYSHI